MRRLALPLALILAGCASPSVGTSFAGVKAGGAQDIGYAREQIRSGVVPRPESFTVEGLYAEHDLPVADAPSMAPVKMAPPITAS